MFWVSSVVVAVTSTLLIGRHLVPRCRRWWRYCIGATGLDDGDGVGSRAGRLLALELDFAMAPLASGSASQPGVQPLPPRDHQLGGSDGSALGEMPQHILAAAMVPRAGDQHMRMSDDSDPCIS